MLYRPLSGFFCLCASVWFSCTAPGDVELEPAYLELAGYKITDTLSGAELPAGEQVLDAVWVSVNGKFHGAFTLPARIPILEEGPTRLRLQPGVVMNGIKATRGIYPFLVDSSLEVNLERGKVLELAPWTRYFSGLSFRMNEDFESASYSLEPAPSNTAMFERTTDPEWVHSGGWSGQARLDTGHTYLELYSDRWLTLPVGRPVWLEIQYRNDVEFLIGMIIERSGQSQNVYKVGLHPQQKWNKLYVNLSELTINQFPGTRFKLIFRAEFGGSGDVQQFIGLDQIRLVHE